jgi:uncharacterized membrane protein YccF (DUF307 family)
MCSGFLIARRWLAIAHISRAPACIATVIGIPFCNQNLKLALMAIAPAGMTVIHKSSARYQ